MLSLSKKKYGKKCPYCGKKISFLYAATHMHDGEYSCDHCKRYSNIKYNPVIYLLIVLAAVCGLYFGTVAFKESIKGIILSIIPFLAVYMTFPLFFKLVPIKIKKTSENNNASGETKKENVKKYIPKTGTPDFESNDAEGSTKYIPTIK